ncbi:carboxypeptidase-like regulatory domain-containing protein [Amycolatopsis sp. TNS106]|uniref:carboxypeptidase-like regulatory domain-containing protein n=1 Tax=Amycolatopsis sp. TNS106 TaxID=2861750 RepID=UPI002102D1C1|nr:carboxypeptidase-like regulatory domain-containing protein [Amycolatopsis sp. TNS106]
MAGVVFGDKNGNGKLDDGEQLADIPLFLRHSISSQEYKATSDADGKIDFGEVPAVEYLLSGGGDSIKGWLFPLKVIRAGADTTDLPMRGVRPLNDALKASVSFTKDTYKPGELAQVTVKLTNYGRLPLVGIVAGCNRAGVDFALKGGPGWGELEYFAGATIAPGQTRIFDVTEKIPDGALNHGRVSVSCDFGYTDVGIGGNPRASDEAAVPGGIATLAGQVIHTADPDKPAKGLAGVKVVLASDGDCPTIVETTTDAEGHFKIANLVPGPKYRLFFAPPQGWRILYDNPISIYVVGPADNPARLHVEAGQGDEPPPTLPTRRPGCDASANTTPAPGTPGNQASGGGAGLARTGADVLGLGTLALAALALGAGLVFTSRRRRHQAD